MGRHFVTPLFLWNDFWPLFHSYIACKQFGFLIYFYCAYSGADLWELRDSFIPFSSSLFVPKSSRFLEAWWEKIPHSVLYWGCIKPCSSQSPQKHFKQSIPHLGIALAAFTVCFFISYNYCVILAQELSKFIALLSQTGHWCFSSGLHHPAK